MRKLSIAASVLGIVALAAYPLLVHNPYYIHLLETIMIYAILLFGLDIVVGYTGQVSLGHAGLFGIGSYVAGVMAFKLGAPFWIAVPASLVITSAFGALLALPALRVTGPYLAMVTLAFGTIIQILINEMTFLTEGPLGIKVPKPIILGHKLDEMEYYYVVLVIMLLSLVVVHRIVRSHLGRAFEALRDSPVACDCMGVSVYRYKVYAFVISAGMAGIAGALYTHSEEYISPNTYTFELTVMFLLAVIMGGRKTRLGPMIGATIVVLLPSLLADLELFRMLAATAAVIAVVAGIALAATKRQTLRQMATPVLGTVGMAIFSFQLENITDWRLTIFGFMTLFIVYYLQDGIVGWFRKLLVRVAPGAVHVHKVYREHGDKQHVWTPPRQTADGELLHARDITMQFGGLKALNQVDLRIAAGTIHGLIGPNGSGKSTMMNVLTGIYAPTVGEVMFAGKKISGGTPSQIALSGIARTFQNVQLFGEMTAIENVLVGLHHTFHSTSPEVMLHLPRYVREEGEARLRAASLLDFVGLQQFHNEEARNLPYGKQRLLEIARAMALDPSLILLDEPAAGLTAPDIKELIDIIRKIRQHGMTVVLIEHHMDVVMSICDTVTVLDFGQKIASGKPAEVQNDPRVVEAYLGGSGDSLGAAPAPTI